MGVRLDDLAYSVVLSTFPISKSNDMFGSDIDTNWMPQAERAPPHIAAKSIMRQAISTMVATDFS